MVPTASNKRIVQRENIARADKKKARKSDAAAPRQKPSKNTPLFRSAAAKTFDIPELLEMILICVSDRILDPQATAGHEGSPDNEWRLPAKRLFVLQRVNRGFNATIGRSALLQQRMFLKSYPVGGAPQGLDFSSPVYWMYQCLADHGHRLSISGRDWEFDLDDKIRFNITCRGMCRYAFHLKNPRFRSSWLNSKASWRKMRIYCIEGYALKDIEFHLYDHNDNKSYPWKAEIEDKAGLPLGLICSRIQELAKCEKSEYVHTWTVLP